MLQAAASRAVQSLAETPDSAPPPVLLAVSPQAARSGWAAQAAVALADALASRGERVMLADLSFDRPELHELLGIENEEGLSDVFIFGVSLVHITRSAPGKSFRLIPASPFTPDPREVLQHERWTRMFNEMATSRTRLLLYLPMDVDGADEFAESVENAIMLVDDADAGRVRLGERTNVRAVLQHPEHAHQHQHETPRRSDAEFEKIRIPKDGARDALIADLRARQRAALMAPAPSMTPLPDAEAIARPARGEAQEGTPGPVFRLRAVHPTGKKESSGWLTRWLLLGMLLGLAAVAGWYWYDSQQAVSTSQAPANGVPAPVAQNPAAPAAVESAGDRLPFSVAIASYQVLDLAESRVQQLAEDEPEMSFFVGPIAVQGSMYYRVMAGPVADSASATSLVESLVSKRIKTITSGWDVLTTPYAYLLGDYASAEDARAQQRTAAMNGIPSYIVEEASTEGSSHHKVYAGAYAGPGDAEFMRPILRAAGLPDNLVERTGSIRT